MSSCSPWVGLLAELEVDEGLRTGHEGHGADPAQDLEQVIVVLADDLRQHVERAGGDDDVVDLLHVGELPGHFLQVAVGLDGDHGLPPEAERQRIGDGHDLHHAGVLEALHALPDGRLGQPYGLADRGIGTPAAMQAAAAAFEGWRDATPSERSLAMFRIADAMEKRADDIVAAETRNTGKPVALTASEEVPPAVDQIRFFAGAARVLEGRSAGEYMKDHTSMIRREPIGVCAQVTPWNYPMMMAVWKFAPAIAAGNAIVLKPSDTTPVSTLLLAEIAAEFLPPGVFNVGCGDRDTGRELISHPTPSMVSITGSVRAGMEVARAAADDLKRVHLELGGKAPVVVFDDADVEATAAGIAGAGYFNAGQDCTAATRVLAGPGIAADLTAALAEQANNTTTGGLDVPDAYFGPVNNA